MPGYRGHLAFAGWLVILVLLLITTNFHVTKTAVLEWILFALLGTVFPDSDTHSMGRKITHFLLMIFLLISLCCRNFILSVIISAIFLATKMSRHRGFFHSMNLLVLIGILLIILTDKNPAYRQICLIDFCFFSLGYVSHILLDRRFKKVRRL